MPELPEVQTTVNGITKELVGSKIIDVWTDYNSSFHAGKNNIKNPHYFLDFKKTVGGAIIQSASRRGKNVLIHLSNDQTILIHMKMTGHLMVGHYEYLKKENTWRPAASAPEALRDPFNKFLHLVFTVEYINKRTKDSEKRQLVFSDMRKFAKVFVVETEKLQDTSDIKNLGLEPLSPDFTYLHFKTALEKRPKTPIKQVLLDQGLIAGIGNIYSDEILWSAGVHPDSHLTKIPEQNIKKMFQATLDTLSKGIDFGGDSMSDYRNIYGEAGKFQHTHNAYRRTGKPCPKKGCKGTITRKKMGGRSAHFCDTHQILFQ